MFPGKPLPLALPGTIMDRLVPPLLLFLVSLSSCSRNIGEPLVKKPERVLYEITLVGPEVTPPTTALLFVGARGSPEAPPSYVRRYPFFPLPLTIYLREQDAMLPGLPVTTAPLYLFARLDRDGDLSTMDPQDLLGETSIPYPPGTTGVILELKKAEALFSHFRVHLLLTGTYPPPPTGTTFVLLIEPRTQAVVAGARFPMPNRLPYEFILGPEALFRPPPRSPLEVYVKLDEDGDPSTQGPQDLRGAGILEGDRLTLPLNR